MKQIIREVLDDMSIGQINLSSNSARELIATTITAALKTKGSYKEYTEYELDEQKARAAWVCSICGENTFEVDSDYIGSGYNHLGCELEKEMTDDELKLPADMKLKNPGVKGDKRVIGNRREGDRREKNWTQKKHEEKAFNQAVFGDSRDLTEASIDKLAEEVVSDNDTNYIYESRDSGKTIYKRKEGSDKRELVKDWKTISGQSKAK